MNRTTIKISDELDAWIRHEAARRGLTISDLTREALEVYRNGGEPRRSLSFASLGRSGHHDTARSIEEILEEEWGRPGRS